MENLEVSFTNVEMVKNPNNCFLKECHGLGHINKKYQYTNNYDLK